MIPVTSAVLLADKDPGRELGISGHFCLLLHDWLVVPLFLLDGSHPGREDG